MRTIEPIPLDADENPIEIGKTYMDVRTGHIGTLAWVTFDEDGWNCNFDGDWEIEEDEPAITDLTGNISKEQLARVELIHLISVTNGPLKGVDIERFMSILNFIQENADLIKRAYPQAFA